jgi:hypothetical protein
VRGIAFFAVGQNNMATTLIVTTLMTMTLMTSEFFIGLQTNQSFCKRELPAILGLGKK